MVYARARFQKSTGSFVNSTDTSLHIRVNGTIVESVSNDLPNITIGNNNQTSQLQLTALLSLNASDVITMWGVSTDSTNVQVSGTSTYGPVLIIERKR